MFKDINISSKRQKQEMTWISGCFCTAFIINIIAIIVYQTQWIEIFTQLLWVLVISVLLYILSILGRLLAYTMKKLFVRK